MSERAKVIQFESENNGQLLSGYKLGIQAAIDILARQIIQHCGDLETAVKEAYEQLAKQVEDRHATE